MSTFTEKVLKIELRGEQLFLLPEKAIYWPDRDMVLIADLHLGKVGHFRKSGIPIPQKAGRSTIDRLESILFHYDPEKVVFLGDLFHSEYNSDWLGLNNLMERYPHTSYILVEGNHDILRDYNYQESKLQLIRDQVEVGPFVLSHEPIEEVIEGKYNLCGHLHPAVRLEGRARQYMRLACFYFGDNTGILPAFGSFTGCAIIKPLKNEKVFVIAEDKVIAVH